MAQAVSDTPDVRRESSRRPPSMLVVAAAAFVGSAWQSMNDALPSAYRPLLMLAAFVVLLLIGCWARSD